VNTTCSACGAENEGGRKFCGECGSRLALACPSCGTPNPPTVRFCGECGASLTGEARPPGVAPAPEAERRLVSILFADLVGFTSHSETRDAEEVRDLLTRYFETCRRLITRYGGTVEKFIGDAVMAVWGAPVANEDDAERAVRAALDLVAAVAELGQEVDAPGLRARAGVLTGEAAVNLAADGQGMVAGDLVNTASRIQAVAEPGMVLVGDSTKRVTEAAVVYEDAGEHELKGKVEPVQLWQATRVVAGARGAQRSSGLEAPFVGRDRELRLVKELFHASAEEGRAQLVSVTGIAGIGKSRLAWEFEKYIDGVAERVFWHRGRCLSYGEGVAYWALAEMVRMRCDIVEDEHPTTARGKLRATIEEHLSDEEERRWVEPRLAHLLGLEDGAPGDQENLFSAWRILFERLAEQAPTVLVFEDVQWADEGLLDFLEYLLEWSRSHPLYVLALARPEFAEKRPTWGAAKRNFTQLYLEPLSADAMEQLLTGLVPGLPEDLRARILARAEGIPLYAVETVRMLLDRGLLAREGHVYRPTGAVETLEVPPTLHALVAARLDGLSQLERRVVQDGAVLGKTFTKQGVAALTGIPEAELEPVLASLTRKEVLSVQADARSPERGQYSFLQDIVRHVAYETLSRKERRVRHLAASEHLARWASDEDEVVEVVAAHLLDAFAAAPEAEDAAEIRERARTMLVRVGDRAGSLAANAEAQRAYERAAELSDDLVERAELIERAGNAARMRGRPLDASAHYEEAIRLFTDAGAAHPAARVSARLAEILWDRGRLEEGVESMERAYQVLAREAPDGDLAALAAQLGRLLFFAGDPPKAMERVEAALEIAEALSLPEVLSQALTTKAILMYSSGRISEGMALMRFSLETALEHDKPSAALRAYFNLADLLGHSDHYADAVEMVAKGLALARRVGSDYWESSFLGQHYAYLVRGYWDELAAMLAELEAQTENWLDTRQAFNSVASVGVTLYVHRGELEHAERVLAQLESLADSADIQERVSFACGNSRMQLARGRPDEALRAAQVALAARESMGVTHEYVKESWVTSVEAAFALADIDKVEELLAPVEALDPGLSSPFLRAHCLRFRAGLAATKGDGKADELFDGAVAAFRELAMPFALAVALVEHAEWLAREGHEADAEAAATEARTTFAALGARPWAERAGALASGAGHELVPEQLLDA
jgi:predicted ATPase/class 3 adenylate cyclase